MNENIKLYNILREKNFTKEEAETVMDFIDETVERRLGDIKSTLVTKEDLHVGKVSIQESFSKVIMFMGCLILGQMALIFFILYLVGAFQN